MFRSNQRLDSLCKKTRPLSPGPKPAGHMMRRNARTDARIRRHCEHEPALAIMTTIPSMPLFYSVLNFAALKMRSIIATDATTSTTKTKHCIPWEVRCSGASQHPGTQTAKHPGLHHRSAGAPLCWGTDRARMRSILCSWVACSTSVPRTPNLNFQL